jgi:hypothetical protein
LEQVPAVPAAVSRRPMSAFYTGMRTALGDCPIEEVSHRRSRWLPLLGLQVRNDVRQGFPGAQLEQNHLVRLICRVHQFKRISTSGNPRGHPEPEVHQVDADRCRGSYLRCAIAGQNGETLHGDERLKKPCRSPSRLATPVPVLHGRVSHRQSLTMFVQGVHECIVHCYSRRS